MMRRGSPLAVLLASLCACERNEVDSKSTSNPGPPVPIPAVVTPQPATPPHLVPRLAELKALAALAPPALDPATAAELSELIELAYAVDVDEDLAARALRRLENDDNAVFALELALDHADANVRTRVAYALGERGSVDSLPALLLRLKVEQEPAPKLWLAGAIVTLGNHCAPAWNAVAERFEDPNLSADAAQIANAALLAAGIPLPENATWDDARTAVAKLRDHWLREGSAMGAEARPFEKPTDVEPRLMAALALALVELSEFQLRPVDEARYVLKHIGRRALPMLRLALTASESYVRAHSVEVARDIGPAARPLEDAILQLLDDPLTRLTATQAAGLLGATSAIPHLQARLVGDDLELACAAAASLGEIGAETSRGALLARLNDETVAIDLRVYAAYGLARLDRAVEGGGVGAEFLRKTKAQKTYHEPTLDELLMNVTRP